jgi:GNAT superfamily N-acetyltransferase
MIHPVDRWPGQCECGVNIEFLDKHHPGWIRRSTHAHHNPYHKKYLWGIPLKAKAYRKLVAEAIEAGGLIVKVPGAGSKENWPLPKLARRMALVASRGRGWGMSTYYPGDVSTDAYLYISKEGYAAGYLSVVDSYDWFYYGEWKEKGKETTIHHNRLPCAYDIFVCKEHRGRGVAHAMVAVYAKDEGLSSPKEIAYGSPFTPLGFAFAEKVAGEGLIVGL